MLKAVWPSICHLGIHKLLPSRQVFGENQSPVQLLAKVFFFFFFFFFNVGISSGTPLFWPSNGFIWFNSISTDYMLQLMLDGATTWSQLVWRMPSLSFLLIMYSNFDLSPMRFLPCDDDVMRERICVPFLSLASRLQSAHFVSLLFFFIQQKMVDGEVRTLNLPI